MKVKLYGFEVQATGQTATIEDLIKHLEQLSGKSDESRNIERRFYFDTTSHKNYYTGLVVTVKNQKKFCKLQDEKGNFKITVENLQGKDKLMDFNFFAINKSNGIGIYQHYFQSCSLNVFGGYLSTFYRNLRLTKISEEIAAFKDKNGDQGLEAATKAIRKKHTGQLKFSPLVRKESLDKILAEYKSINAFEFEYSVLEPVNKKGVPLGKYVTKRREKLTFSRNSSMLDLGRAIVSEINRLEPKNGRVHVKDEYGENQSVRIFDMPDYFGDEEYDDVAMKLHNLDVQSFAAHKVAKELIAICGSDDYKHIFEARIREK